MRGALLAGAASTGWAVAVVLLAVWCPWWDAGQLAFLAAGCLFNTIIYGAIAVVTHRNATEGRP